jgi:hypothetical protein
LKLFECQSCGQPLYFDNRSCVSCGHRLGFLPQLAIMSAVEPDGAEWRSLADPSGRYRFCANAAQDACNWLVAAGGNAFCECCRHNRTIPSLGDGANVARWRRLEFAAHHLFYQIIRFGLPHPDRLEDPVEGLAFDFLQDGVGPDGAPSRVLTGHDHGLITINIAEADDAARERLRLEMGESYRTVLGHFRHEIGHYYFDRLVRDGGEIEGFRALFGDERRDYAEALNVHYSHGPPGNWQNHLITPYAGAHPWEDWAETFAHYMHIVDTLETARAFGLRVRPRIRRSSDLDAEVDFDPYRQGTAVDLVEQWLPLTYAVNSLNRSMGQPDLYPFVMSHPVVEKLDFINRLVKPKA